MQRRKKNQDFSLNTGLKKSSSSPQKVKPFQYMWSNCEQNKMCNYDALLDNNAHSYFLSPSIVNHCRHLENYAKRSQNRSSSNLLMKGNLARKRLQVRKDFANLDRNIYLPQNDSHKIIPYTATLKPSSKSKFEQAKKNFVSHLISKERELQQFLKNKYHTKEPESQEIRVVNTLQPIQQLDFMKKNCHFNANGRQFTVLFRPRNSQSLKS